MRDHSQRLLGIQPRPPRDRSDRVRLAFLIKNADDKRQMLVPPAVLRAVRRKFPEVDIELHHAQNEDEDVQVQWLSRVDILVGNVGSPGFRMIYLADGAQVCPNRALVPHVPASVPNVSAPDCICWAHADAILCAFMQMILVGAGEFSVTAADGSTANIPNVWNELDQCWDAVSYFQVHRYHVTREADVKYRPVGDGLKKQFAKRPDRLVYYKIRDSHVTVRPAPFVAVLRRALRSLRAQSVTQEE